MPCVSPGRLEQLDIPDFSDATVYLPAEYDRTEARYPVFFLLHGGGGDQHSFFSEDGLLKNMFDHMIERQEMNPVIIITPTYYAPGRSNEGIAFSDGAVRDFVPILTEKILPLAEAKYRTIPDRFYRGIGGFSMGAVATWYVLMTGLNAFYWYMPMSGDSWFCGQRGGSRHPKQTAGLMATALQGKEFFIHALTGEQDIAFPNLDPQIQAMKEHPEVFQNRLKYSVLPEGVHDYSTIRRYIYNALPEFFIR